MSASKHQSKRHSGRGEVVALPQDQRVAAGLAKETLDSEPCVIPLNAHLGPTAGRGHCASPQTDRLSADILPLAQGRGNIPLDKAAEAAITELLNAARTANRHAACLWLRAGDYNLLEGIYGHDMSLEFMALVEARLSESLRGVDLFSRVSSNEFVVVLKDVKDRDDAARIGERLLASCSGVYRVAGSGLHVQCNAGVAMYPGQAADPYQLARYARMALPELSPKQPNQCHFFSPGLLNGLYQRAWMTAELERALDQSRLVLHYQPQYAIDTGEVIAVEALVRLVSESGEITGPSEFIELAEETGQILELGRWVIEEACEQLGRWQRAGVGRIRMAVNVSPCQLAANDFCAVVDNAVARAGICHADLELEITERQVVENLPRVEENLRVLTAQGVRVAVDDFGTGYSSLAYLAELPVSTVKLDRTFISRITEDARAGCLVNCMIAMARELGLGLTAEGIETAGQRQFLLDSGCALGQGYGFARPQGARAIERFLF